MTDTTPASDVLLARIAAGHAAEADWRLLIERHADAMRRAAALGGGDDLMDDAVQEVLLHLRRCAARFKARGGDAEVEVRRWLQRLAVNCALNLRRSEARRHQRETVHAEMSMSQRSDDGGAWTEQLAQALGRLDQDERQVLLLRHVEGLDHNGLAAALGTNEAAARKRLSRAHERLRAQLTRASCSLSLPLLTERLDVLRAAPLPPHPATAWIHAAVSGKAPILPAHLVVGGTSAMTIGTLIAVPALVAAVAVGAAVLTAGAPVPAPPPLHAGDQPAAEQPHGTRWQRTEAGTYGWGGDGNWSAASPDGPGAVADLDVGLRGDIVVTLDHEITLGTLHVGDSGGAAGAATTIAGGKTIVFAGAHPGAPTELRVDLAGRPNGVNFSLPSLIRLGGGSPLTATIAGSSVFTCSLGGVDLAGGRFTLAGPRRYEAGDIKGVAWRIGEIRGAGEYLQEGAGTILEQASRAFTGTLTIDCGDFIAAQGLPTVPRIVLGGAHGISDKYPCGGKLTVGSRGPAPDAPDLLDPDAVLVFRGGFLHRPGPKLDEVPFIGKTRPVVVDRVRQLQFTCSLSQLQLENGNDVTSSTTLLVTDPAQALVRRKGATLMIGGDDMRSKQAMFYASLGTAEKLLFASGMTEQLKGAGGPPGSQTRSIIPWITIGTMYHPAQGLMATYDPVDGVRALRRAELSRTIAGEPGRNVWTGDLALGAGKSQTVNALIYDSWNNADIGAGSTLTIASGFLQFMGGQPSRIGDTPANAGTISFGAAEGVIWTGMGSPWGPNILGATLAGSGGVTFTGSNVLVLKAANTYTGGTCIDAGVIQIGDGTRKESRLGPGDVEVAAGAALRIKSGVVDAIADSATVSLLVAGSAFAGRVELERGIDEHVAALTLDGVTQPPGTYGGPESAAVHKLERFFGGPGLLTVTGAK